jgi:hypothetical protein
VFLNQPIIDASGISDQGIEWIEQPGNYSKFDADIINWLTGPVLGFKLACSSCGDV